MSTPENPPAFPRPYSRQPVGDDRQAEDAQSGMTLRDYFAAKAMVGLIALLPNPQADAEMIRLGFREGEVDRFVAKCAYDYADAMLAARNRAGEEGR